MGPGSFIMAPETMNSDDANFVQRTTAPVLDEKRTRQYESHLESSGSETTAQSRPEII